jgi:inner membrane protein
MDTITHTLFGLTAYGAVNKDRMAKHEKHALLFTSVAGSNIPDIDVIMRVTEVGRIMDLMWHRGITHSIIFIPIWTLLLIFLCSFIWKVTTKKIIYVTLFSVSFHVFSDLLNTWGTGIFEPFSSIRVSIGILSIVDSFIWGIILIGFLATIFIKKITKHNVYQFVWIGISFYILFQGIHGYTIYQSSIPHYDKVVLRADFIPLHSTVIGKKDNIVEISTVSIFQERQITHSLTSDTEADLTYLFEKNPKAKVLMEWAPFVIIVDSESEIAIFDPRFFINGESFLYESVKK